VIRIWTLWNKTNNVAKTFEATLVFQKRRSVTCGSFMKDKD